MTDPKVEIRPRTRAIRQLPEPARGWVAFGPRKWRVAGGWWTHLAEGELRFEVEPEGAVPDVEASLDDLDDLLYLPPVDPTLRLERDRLARLLAQKAVPLLLQHVPGDTWDPFEPPNVSATSDEPELGDDSAVPPPPMLHLVDLTPPLLSGDLGPLAELPAGCSVLWPLVPGITDPVELWDEALELLVARGVAALLPLVVEIPPRLRRQLAEGREDHVFDALFHGSALDERALARHAHRAGLEVLPARPETGATPRQVANRKLAGELALAAELWLRLDRPIAGGQALLRAARGAEQAQQDLTALARERNLKVLDWLDARSVTVIQDLVAGTPSRLLQALRAEYLGDTAIPEPELPPP